MRKLFTILLVFVFSNMPAQSIDKIIQTNIETTVDKKIAVFSSTLDSVLIKTTTTTGSFNIDTIKLPIGGSALYQISITGTYTTAMVSGVKFIGARNNNGIYSLTRMTDDLNFSGLTGYTWAVSVINNLLIVRITATIPYLVKWKYRRMNL